MEVFQGTARGTSLPVVFFDGVQEISLGEVSVSSRFNFKHFQSTVGEKLGVSSHQFSVYLTNRENRGSRVPVTGKMDFAAVSREENCAFLVVLKRSRRRERRRNTRGMDGIGRHRYDPPGNVMLLRREGNMIAVNGGGVSRLDLDLDRSGFERRIKELQVEKERYLMNMGLAFEGLSLEPERTNTAIVCHECLRAKEIGRDSGFHWCVYDTVTVGFRSPAGPIARPAKGAG